MEPLAVLTRARGPTRAKVTRLAGEIKDLISATVLDKVVLRARRVTLSEAYQVLRKQDQEFMDLMVNGNYSEQDIEAESVACDKWENRVQETLQKLDLILNPVRPASPAPSESVDGERSRSFRLPKIELRRFNGDLKEWLPWWAQFEKIHSDPTLHDSDKIHYLVQAMVPGTRARELVESYPHSAENYPRVIAALQDRFGKEKLLKQVYVRELLGLVIKNYSGNQAGKITVAQLYDRLESHLRALESLQVNPEQMAVFLYPMVESSLPEDVLVAWQRSPFYGREVTADPEEPQTELYWLMEFLKREVEGEEQRTLAKAGFGMKAPTEQTKEKKRTESRLPTAAGLVSGVETFSCVFCGGAHEGHSCFAAQDMSLKEKKAKLLEKKACFLCLKIGHTANRCKVAVRCIVCRGKHVTLMCKLLPLQNKSSLEQTKPQKPQRENTEEPENLQTTLVGPMCSGKVVLQTLMVVIVGNGIRRQVRALLDSGSQRSYIKKETAESLGLVPHAEESLRHVVFGGTSHTKIHRKYMVTVASVKGGVSRKLELIDQDRICGALPRMDEGPWMQALRDRKIQLSDVGEGAPEIEILFGSDCLGSILLGRVLHLQNGMAAVQTRFGWTVMGKTDRQEDISAGLLTISLTVSEAKVSDLWSLESIGISDPAESFSRKERENEVLLHFQKTVSRGTDGRYSVCLPWTTEMHEPPDNRQVALKRLSTTTNKLIAADCYEAYNGVFQSWLEEGIIEVVPEAEQERPSYYLPHRAVLRPESRTTPIRPVFDASCKTGRSPSLNECLECGPNLIELLPTIILRFRKGIIGVVSDIRRAFLQIEVNPQDRDFLRFLWWSDDSRSDCVIYRHRRVVFGVKSSPFLLGAVINHHLNKLTENQETKNLVSTGEKLRRSLYVDNCVASVDSVEELEQFKKEAALILNQAKLDLQDWEEASAEFPDLPNTSDPTEIPFSADKRISKVLGLSWQCVLEKDTLSFVFPTPPVGLMTKRSILSGIAGVYDSVGVLCPALIEPRLIVQRAWASKCSWDEELSSELKTRYEKWWKEAPMLSKVAIPRNMSAGVCKIESWQLHIFCDASQDAFAAVSFLRTTVEKGTSVQLIMARARISPLKKPSMPRLELLACTIGARLGATIRQDLELDDIQTFFWSDSTTALAWIRRNDAWGTFVGNRVKEICGLSKPNEWRHVPGTLNPADLPSRGCSPRRLLESRWWEGPAWLRGAQNEWPNEVQELNEKEIQSEKRLTAVKVGLVVTEAHWVAKRFSSYRKNVRVVAWILRFLENTRLQGQRISGDLSADEFRKAEYAVFRLIQRDCFDIGREEIEGLRVQCGENGLIRVKTKLLYREDSMDFRLPILLPGSHPLVEQLIRLEHEEHGHCGVQSLMGILRERFWIVRGKRVVKRLLKSCMRCRRFSSRGLEVEPASLPKDRASDARVFEVVGVDLAGPLFLRDGSKAWIVLFTCAVYRCVHLELVTSLSTESFLWAMDRFVARRGRPSVVYSDNGTNFVGAVNIFKRLDWDRIRAVYEIKRIRWCFIPPASPWWGGWWERLIRMVKDLLKRMLGRSSLSYQGMLTVLCEVEALLNGRPLTCVSEEQSDLITLTPGMFLRELPGDEFPEFTEALKQNPKDKYRHLIRLREELRARFRKEYLSLLVQRGRKRYLRELKVGDVVLVGTDNKKRILWPLAKVETLLPGKDGAVRVAKVRTATGLLVRPLQRLYPLEFQPVGDIPSLPENSELSQKCKEAQDVSRKVTKSGRIVKPPLRYQVGL